MTSVVALIGNPLGHSISPFFQQAALDYCQLDARYEKWEVEAPELEAVVGRLRQASMLGGNVTLPYKEAVMPLLDQLDELAAQIGAVNTIVNREGRLIGYNTDAPAFIAALRKDAGFEPRGACAVILGAGGVARAVSFALVQEDARRLIIVNRTAERGRRLADSLKSIAHRGTEIAALPWEQMQSDNLLIDCDLVVNCTSLGMKRSPGEGETPITCGAIPSHALVCDLVYNPLETPLLRQAAIAGASILGGLAMLVHQGAMSFRLWTGREAPLDIMFTKARQALGTR